MTMLFGTFSTKDNGFVVDAGTLLANIGPIVVKNSLKALAISKLLVIVFPLIHYFPLSIDSHSFNSISYA